MRKYKVYLIKTRPAEEIVYVGMTGLTLHRRFMEHVRKKKLNPKDYYIGLVQEELSLEEAATLEGMLIAQYKAMGCNLYNKVGGSKNGYSNPHSEDQKKRWSEERKGKPFKGRQHRTSPNSEQHNQKISEANSKALICLNSGKVYASMREACRELNLSESKVSLVCNGKRPHTRKYMFRFITG